MPVADHPFSTHKKIVREILNEVGTFLEVIELIRILSINNKPKSIMNIGEKLRNK